MKKLILSGLIACLLAPVFALTWNGVIDNNTYLTSNKDFSLISLQQQNGVHLSLNAPFNTSGTLKFVAEGSFKYKLSTSFPQTTNAFNLIADCDLLKFSGKWTIGKGIVAVDIGRFMISDISGYVFTQKSDGLSLSYDALKFKAGVYAGYTGLQNRLNVSMLNNSADAVNLYGLTAGYVPVMLNFTYKTLFETNTIGLQGEVFLPVNTEDKTKYFYGTLMMNGPIGVLGAYTLKGTVGLGDFKNLMADAGLDLNFYIANTAIAVVGGEFVSFEKDSLHKFVSITNRTISTDPLFAGGVLPKVSLIYAKGNILASVTGKGVIAMGNETKFHGIDAAASFVCNVFSDLQIGCDLTAFIGIDNDVKDSSNYSATIKASLAF